MKSRLNKIAALGLITVFLSSSLIFAEEAEGSHDWEKEVFLWCPKS